VQATPAEIAGVRSTGRKALIQGRFAGIASLARLRHRTLRGFRADKKRLGLPDAYMNWSQADLIA